MGTKTCHNWFFEAKGTFRVSLVGQLQALFEEYKLTNNINCYVKDEDTNLSTMSNVFKHIITSEKLGMHAPFTCVCFGHAFSKACQSATFNKKK